MFTVKQPDSFALRSAETINRIGSGMLNSLRSSMIAGFRELFYDNAGVRPRADVRRILAAFDRPADLFESHAATVTFLLSQSPGILTPAEFTPPYDYVINADGTVTIPEGPDILPEPVVIPEPPVEPSPE